MPTVLLYGKPCRCQAMLGAIAAQEALEAHGVRERGKVCRGPTQERMDERDRMALARKRNAMERKLRDEERYAWGEWRKANAAQRAAVYAMLTDPPGTEHVDPLARALTDNPEG